MERSAGGERSTVGDGRRREARIAKELLCALDLRLFQVRREIDEVLLLETALQRDA